MAGLATALGMDMSGRSNKVVPHNSADSFFGKPEMQQQMIQDVARPTKCASGVLALRVPDPPLYAPPAVCAISKDGKIAAVGGKDVELYLWDTDTGELLSTLRGHEIAWTGSNDNTFFVTVQEDNKVNIWDQQSIKLRQMLGHPDEPLTTCSISLNDKFVVVGGSRGGVYSWDSEGGTVYRQYHDGHVGPVATVMCYPMEDGTHIIISCGAADHMVVVWDLEASTKRSAILIDELEHAKNVKYHISKDGTQVVAWCTDSVPFPNLIFVDALNNTKNSVFCHGGLVRYATFAKDSARIISCGGDGHVVVWDTLSLEPQLTVSGHVGAVLCCACNDDDTRLVTSGEDCTVRVWSTEDGAQLMMMQAQDEPVKSVAYAKGAGNKILSCDMMGRVYVWKVLSEVVASLIRRFADTLSAVTMCNHNTLLAAGANNGRVMLWDAVARENLWEYSHHSGRVECLAFNTLRDLVASSGADGRVAVIATDSGKQVNAFTGPSDEPIFSLAFSPDDEKLAGVTADGKLLVFLVTSDSRAPRHVLCSSIGRIMTFAWSPNSKLLVGCGSDGCAMVWNATTGSIFTVLEGQTPATCCTFDLLGKLLAVGGVQGATTLYNLDTAEQLCELRSNASSVVDVVFNQDQTRLTTICSRQAIIWDAATTQKIRVYDFVYDKTADFMTVPRLLRTTVAHSSTVLFDPESEALVYDMVPVEDPLLRSPYLSDTRMITSGNQGHKRVMVWSAAGTSAPDKFHTTHDAITSCHFGLDDRLVVMGTQDGNLVVYDVLHGETVEIINAHQGGPCRCVRLSHDNSCVLSCGADCKVILWDWRQRQATRIFTGHFISIGTCDISYNDARVVSGDNHGMISVWEKVSGDVVQTLPLAHARAVLCVSISSDGSTVASVGADGKVSIWNVDVGVELVSLTAAIESHPLYCCFSADGNKLAVTESNGNVMVWNTFAGCQWYQIPAAHKGRVNSCNWSFDCRRLVTAGQDSVLAVWDAESGAPLFKFPVKTGPQSCVAVSPRALYLAGGSNTGTLSVVSIPQASRALPEPSFLYHWLAHHERKQSAALYTKLAAAHPHLANVQDAQGWSLLNHVVAKGNAAVASMVLDSYPSGAGTLALISAVPFQITTRVQFHGAGEEGFDAEGNPTMPEPSGKSVLQSVVNIGRGLSTRFMRSTDSSATMDEFRSGVQKSNKSTLQVKKVAVDLFTEQRQSDQLDLIMNNALALALNSKSSECVQVVLDAAAGDKVSFGSYHAITDMMASLAVRYPYMCYQFLAQMELASLGDLEVPVDVIRGGLEHSVIRTAPIFTNVRNLWQAHLATHSVRVGQTQPYAHVRASMVRLPFACSVGRDSLLQTLVESEVPVNAFGTPTLRAVIKHKWRLYARTKLLRRAVVYMIYTLVFTVYAILYSMEDHDASLREYWRGIDSGLSTPGAQRYSISAARAQFHILADAYLFLQSLWFAWTEGHQMWASGMHMYFKSGWNLLDVCSIIMMLIITPLHVARVWDQPGGAMAPLIAIELITLWFKVFFYALAFEPTGPVVHMVFQISYAVRSWAVLLFMNMVAFGVALQVLYQYTPSDDSFADFGNGIFTLYNSLFGVYSMDVNLVEGSWRQLAIVFWAIFLFLCNIVLLNMLIALMRDIYQQVRDTQQEVFLKGRAQHIIEVEMLMSSAQLEEHSLMPPYMHLLTEVKRKVHNSDSLWGRLDRLEAMFVGMGEQLGKLMLTAGLRPEEMQQEHVIVSSQQQQGVRGQGLDSVPQGMMQLPGHMGMGMPGNPHGMMHLHGMLGMPGMPGMPGMGGIGQGPMGMQGLPGMPGMNMMAPGMMHPHMSQLLAMIAALLPMGGMAGPTAPGEPGTEQANLVQLTAQRLRDGDGQLPAIVRQMDRLQRTINNQEMRLEGMVIVLRDIENLLRNQQPVIIHQETRAPTRRAPVLSEAELEQEVKRLLGKGGPTRI